LFTNVFEMDPGEYPDHTLLSASKYKLSKLLLEIQSVSFGERLNTSRPFQFHPLWLECTRHAMHGRVQIISQVLNRLIRTLKECIITDEVNVRETFSKFVPHVRHCLKMCKSFKIELEELKPSPNTLISAEFKALYLHPNPIDYAIEVCRIRFQNLIPQSVTQASPLSEQAPLVEEPLEADDFMISS
jgi:hypothetical protein